MPTGQKWKVIFSQNNIAFWMLFQKKRKQEVGDDLGVCVLNL